MKKEKVADGDLNPIKTNPAVFKGIVTQLPFYFLMYLNSFSSSPLTILMV